MTKISPLDLSYWETDWQTIAREHEDKINELVEALNALNTKDEPRKCKCECHRYYKTEHCLDCDDKHAPHPTETKSHDRGLKHMTDYPDSNGKREDLLSKVVSPPKHNEGWEKSTEWLAVENDIKYTDPYFAIRSAKAFIRKLLEEK